jgi:putative hemolysin
MMEDRRMDRSILLSSIIHPLNMALRQILIIFLLILANGVFAMAEAAVISARKARLQERANQGDKSAASALDLANAPSRFLSTTQFGITLISILAGAFGGATLTDDLATWLARYPVPEGWRHGIALAVVVGGITYVSLVIGELVPKRLALNSPEGIAARVAGPMRRLSAIAAPVVTVLGASTDAVVRILGVRRSDEPPVTEEEVKILIGQGAAAGVFLPSEQDLVQGVFRLGDRRVNELMVPRVRVAWLDLDDPLEENLRKMAAAAHSRFPVADGALDRLAGVVSVRAVWARQMAGEPVDLRALAWMPPLVPEELPAVRALENFRTSGREMAVVLSEYGGVQGILTLTDVLGSVVGEIRDLPGAAAARAARREDGAWLLDGLLPAAEVKEILGLRTLPNESDTDYESLGGFVMDRLQRLPSVGDSFAWHDYRWEVAALDGKRVAKVIVRPEAKAT